MLRLFATSLAALALSACATPSRLGAVGDAAPHNHPATGSVSAADPRAEDAGRAMLAAGGNATDAAIAVMLALTVVEPQSSGIGGGGFLVHAAPDGSVATFDGRETAPAGARPEWFLRDDGTLPSFDESVQSGLSVGVPGNIRMAALAHSQHGKLPWAKLFEPAIELARNGFRINQRLYNSISAQPGHAGFSATARKLYFDAEGKVLPAGSLVQNEQLALTFERIAREGPDAFYTSALGDAIAATVAQATPKPGAMTIADVRGYAPRQREAVCGSYRKYRICSMGPPSSGGIAVLQILGQLERFDLRAMGKDNPATWHLFIEAQRLAYADRELYLADPDFVDVPIAGLIAPDYIAARSNLIDPAQRTAKFTAGTPAGATTPLADGDEPTEEGTSHFAAVDKGGVMVSYTSTIESAFGSGLMANGFYLNNELTDFSRAPMVGGRLVANRVEGGKRPRSSMSPTVIWDPAGEPFMVVGAAGGPTIPVSTARAIIGAIDFDLSAQDALALPFLMAFGDNLLLEQGTWLQVAVPQFEAMGYTKIALREAPIKVNAILRKDGSWQSARDPRIETGLDVP